MGASPSACEVHKGCQSPCVVAAAPAPVAVHVPNPSAQWTGAAGSFGNSGLLRETGGGGTTTTLASNAAGFTWPRAEPGAVDAPIFAPKAYVPPDPLAGNIAPRPLAAAAEKARTEFEKAESALQSAASAAVDAGRIALGWDGANNEASAEGEKPQIVEGMKQAMQGNPDEAGFAPSDDEGKLTSGEHEKEPEHDEVREWRKAIASFFFVIISWSILFTVIFVMSLSFEAPPCEARLAQEKAEGIIVKREMCEPCGSGTHFAPFYREYEQSWPKGFRAFLYLFGLLWIFLGINVVCDAFMGAIEEITSRTKDVWMNVHEGSKHKFRVKVWNPTVANLTLMALGSSAPEILLNVIEITGSNFFAGELGPSTIVGSASFNLLMITSVCISAIPAPDVRRIEQTTVFAWTASMSLFAYMWMVFVLRLFTPDKVDLVEAVLTFLFFPLLVIVAYIADRGYCTCQRRNKKIMTRGETWEEAETSKIQAKFGKALPEETLKFLLKQQDLETRPQGASKYACRQQVMQNVTGKKSVVGGSVREILTFGFVPSEYAVLECAGTVTIKFAASEPHPHTVDLSYRTVEGTAKAALADRQGRYRHKEGKIRFLPGQVEKTIEIDIIDNDVWEPDEEFTVEITNLEVVQSGGTSEPCIGAAVAIVTVLNDDIPGTFGFEADEIYTCEGQMATLGINRTQGVCGEVQVHYRTISDSAIENRDYVGAEGYVEFQNGETHKIINIEILAQKDHFFEEEERFKVMLDELSPGAKFDKDTDGGESAAYCDVIIAANRKLPVLVRCGRHFFNMDKFKEDMSNWAEQFTGALYCNGGAEEQYEAGLSDWFFHCLSLVWKLLFALVPPPSFCGGWVCFWAALAMIGLVTAFVGDIANLLGCCVGLSGDITAITLVALGTSLPDTFASKLAAEQDDTADNSVGNVTGSNSVNVFLGLGLPWTIAAVYWQSAGVTQDWLDAMDSKGVTFGERFLDDYPGGGFMVPAESLVFSVIVFTSCALMTMAVLVLRRFKYGGELGGPKSAQMRDSAFLALLWFVYIAASIAYSVSQS